MSAIKTEQMMQNANVSYLASAVKFKKQIIGIVDKMSAVFFKWNAKILFVWDSSNSILFA